MGFKHTATHRFNELAYILDLKWKYKNCCYDDYDEVYWIGICGQPIIIKDYD